MSALLRIRRLRAGRAARGLPAAGIIASWVCLVGAVGAASTERGMIALEERRWIQAMGEFLEALEKDPSDRRAKAHIALITQQLASQDRTDRRAERLTILALSSQILESGRRDAEPLQRAIQETATAEARLQQERWQLTCEEARMKREAGQLPAAQDLVLQVLEEDPSAAPAQRELSELQSALRRAMEGGMELPILDRYVYEGFYAYGQADYERALRAWKKARALIDPMPEAQAASTLKALRFERYQARAEERVEIQRVEAEVRRLFDAGLDAYRRSQFIRALDIFRQVAIQNPDYPLLGHYLVKTEAGAEAERAQRLGERKRRSLVRAYEEGAEALRERRFPQAIKAFEKVLRLDPTHTQARSYLSMARAELARRQDPKAAQLRYESGLVAYASGKLEEAAREWRIALRLNPDFDKARTALQKVQRELAMTPSADEALP